MKSLDDSSTPGKRPEPGALDTGADAESRAHYAGWRVAAAAGGGVFCAALVVVTFPVLLKSFTAEFGWSRQEIATAFGLAALAASVGAAPLGFLLDRVTARRVSVPCLAVFGCVFASLAWLTPNLAHLYACFVVLGVAGIGSSPVAFGRTISTWFQARRGLALAIVVSGGALGGVVHPPLLDALIARIGWRGACFTLGALVLAVGLPCVAWLVREREPHRSASAPLAGTSVAAALREPAFWLLLVGMVGGTCVQNSVIVHLYALLTDRGVAAASAAFALSTMAAAAVAGRLLTGVLIDRLHAARVGMVMLVIAALGAYLLCDARSLAAGACAAALVGFGTGGESDVVPYLVSRRFGLRSFSTLYGLAWMAGGLGGALGPILMGRGFDASGSYERALQALAFVALAAALSLLPLALRASPAAHDAHANHAS